MMLHNGAIRHARTLPLCGQTRAAHAQTPPADHSHVIAVRGDHMKLKLGRDTSIHTHVAAIRTIAMQRRRAPRRLAAAVQPIM